jgi:hypothetical protein
MNWPQPIEKEAHLKHLWLTKGHVQNVDQKVTICPGQTHGRFDPKVVAGKPAFARQQTQRLPEPSIITGLRPSSYRHKPRKGYI